MAIITTSGFPADTTGSSGDYAIDPAAHFIYGPKTTTWAGTASSLQGPSGPGMVYGQGAPTSNQGAIGQGYVDLATGNFYGPKASNGAWGNAVSKIQGAAGTSALTGSGSPTSNSVAGVQGQSYYDYTNIMMYVYNNGSWGTGQSLVGPAGYTALTTQATSGGSFLAVGSLTLSSTPYVVPYPGTSAPAYYASAGATALIGFSAEFTGSSGASVSMELYNTTTSSTVTTISLTAATGYLFNNYTSTQFPLAANNLYVWRLTGSGTVSILCFQPFYLSPAAGPTGAISTIDGFWSPAGTTFSTTQLQAQPFTVSTTGAGWHPVKNVSLYRIKMTYIPSTAGAATATVNCLVRYYNYSSGAFVNVATGSVTNTGLPQYAGPYTIGSNVIAAGQSTVVTLTGSGTGQVLVSLEVAL